VGRSFAEARALILAPQDKLVDTLRAVTDSWPEPDGPVAKYALGFNGLTHELLFICRVMLEFYAQDVGEAPDEIFSRIERYVD